jgi:hypothetical protein
MAEPGRELSSINFEAMLGGPLVAVINAQAQSAMTSVKFIKSVGFKPLLDNEGKVIPDQVGDPIYVTFKYPKEIAPFKPAVSAAVVQINVLDGGEGYDDAAPPQPTFSGGGGGSGLVARAIVNGGRVTSIEITSSGSGYTSAPTVTIPAPPTSVANARQATATAIFRDAERATPAEYRDMKLEVPILTMLPIPFIRIEETTIDFNAKINSVEESKTDDAFKFDLGAEGSVNFGIGTVSLKVNTSYQKNTSSGSKVDRTYSMAVHIRAVQDEMPAGTERILGILEDAIRATPT